MFLDKRSNGIKIVTTMEKLSVLIDTQVILDDVRPLDSYYDGR